MSAANSKTMRAIADRLVAIQEELKALEYQEIEALGALPRGPEKRSQRYRLTRRIAMLNGLRFELEDYISVVRCVHTI